MNFYLKREETALAQLNALLALPSIPADGCYSDGECFNPWDLFPSLYGSYSCEFDDMAIAVLEDIRDQTHKRSDLACQMFREMLCQAGFCEYGTSPHVCFPAGGFRQALPLLIDRWKEYRSIQWGEV